MDLKWILGGIATAVLLPLAGLITADIYKATKPKIIKGRYKIILCALIFGPFVLAFGVMLSTVLMHPKTPADMVARFTLIALGASACSAVNMFVFSAMSFGLMNGEFDALQNRVKALEASGHAPSTSTQ